MISDMKTWQANYYKNRRKERSDSGQCVGCGGEMDRVGDGRSGKQGKAVLCLECSRKAKQRQKDKRERDRKRVFTHYGNKCQCCGLDNPAFLTIDHVNNDGNKYNKKVRVSICSWIIRNGFPKDIQLLCWNCNCGKRMNNGICPHQFQQSNWDYVI